MPLPLEKRIRHAGVDHILHFNGTVAEVRHNPAVLRGYLRAGECEIKLRHVIHAVYY